jgi:hypothetical protein
LAGPTFSSVVSGFGRTDVFFGSVRLQPDRRFLR